TSPRKLRRHSCCAMCRYPAAMTAATPIRKATQPGRSEHMITRRHFLQSTVALGCGLAMAPGFAQTAPGSYPFGIQLYTLRAVMPQDPEGVLRQLAGFGYHQIESYEGPQGMFWGKTPGDFRRYVNELGMELLASHCSIDNG